MVKADVGHVVRWGETIMLIVDRVNTDNGEKWKCLVLVTGPGWDFAYPPGAIGYFRDVDFTARLAP